MYFVVLNNVAFLIIYPLVLPRGDDVITGTLQCGVSFLFINENKTNVQTKQPLCKKNKTYQKHGCRYKADMTIRYIININN